MIKIKHQRQLQQWTAGLPSVWLVVYRELEFSHL